jgi:hypothetical protein
MRAIAGPDRTPRVNYGLAVLLVCSAVVGVLAGITSNLDIRGFFRVLVLANLLVVAYMLLLKDIVVGILIYMYSLVFLNYYWRIIIPGLWPDLDLPRMVFVFVWLIFLLENLMGTRRMLPNSVIGTTMLLVLGAFVLSMVLTGKVMIRQFLNGYVIPYAMFVIASNVFANKRAVDRFIFWLAVPLAFYFPVTAILEHYEVSALLFPRYIGKVVEGEIEITWGGRAMGTFAQPVVTGFAMIAVYVLALYSLGRVKNRLASVYAVLLSAVTPIGVFFTYTRAVFLGYFAALLVLLVLSRKHRVTATIMVAALSLAVIGNWSRVTSAEREAGGVAEVATAQTRVVLAHASFSMFLDHPLVGVGFTNFVAASRPYIGRVRTTFLGYREAWMGTYTNQHNQFLSVLTEIGLVGFIPFVLMYCLLFAVLVKARRVAGANYDLELLAAVSAVLAAYVAQIMFFEPRYFEFMNVLPFMLAGIIVGGYQRAGLARAAAAQGQTNNLRKEYAT